jgi:hypothetical protein
MIPFLDEFITIFVEYHTLQPVCYLSLLNKFQRKLGNLLNFLTIVNIQFRIHRSYLKT